MKIQTEFLTGSDIDVMLYISPIIKNKILSLPTQNNDELGISKFDDDIIFVDHPIIKHTDNTKIGFNTILCVITNEADFIFNYDNEAYGLPSGRVIRFDGNISHSLEGHLHSACDNVGRFSAIIWDIPVGNSFVKETSLLAARLIKLIYNFS